MQIELSKERRYLGIVCLIAIAVMLPIAIFGIPTGNDLSQHFQFAQAYYDSILNGDGFPNWSSRENFGYGSIGIRFYPPLSYYVLAFARIISGSWFDAAWMAFMSWMVLGCLGIYFWARWWMKPKEATIAAAFFATFPYHLNQLYIAFVYADFAGAAILPFCFGFLTRVCDRGKRSDVLGLAASFAALILTHLPTTIIGSMCLAFYMLAFLQKGKITRQIANAGVGIGLGLAASSYYWVRMISEMSWLNHASEQYSSGHYFYGNRFFPTFLYGIATDHKDNLVLSDILTTLSLLCFTAALFYLLYRKIQNAEIGRESLVFKIALPLAGFAFFMTTPFSRPIWAIAEPLQKIQFPARWMSVVAMCGALIVGASAHFISKGNFLKQRRWAYTTIAFVSMFLFIDFVYIWYPSAFVPTPRAEFESQMRELSDQENHQFWWSVWSQPNALKIKEKVVANGRKSTVTNWNPEERSFAVESGQAENVRVATFWYPRWQAEVNGNPVEVGRDENGAILIPVPAEKATVRLWFQETAGFRIACVISGLAWLLMLSALAFNWLGQSIRLRAQNPLVAEEEFS
jgi:Predicted integral membrane protein